MRWQLRSLAVVVISAGCWLPAFAHDGTTPEAATCGDFGTSVHFEKTPKDAAKKALKEEKLVFVLHISGLFENSEFT